MAPAKTKAAYNRYKSAWQWSRRFAQAFYIGKKLERAITLPERASLEWKEKSLSLKDLEIHKALGIKLLEANMNGRSEPEFRMVDYCLVCKEDTFWAAAHIIDYILKPVKEVDRFYNGKLGEREREDTNIVNLLKKSPIFSRNHRLDFIWIPPDDRPAPYYEYLPLIDRPRGLAGIISRLRSHPLERIKAFFWTRKNYDLLTQAEIIKQPPKS